MRTTLRLLTPFVLLAALSTWPRGGLQQSVASVVNTPSAASSFYVVRADPRLCPSPLCGGYWVARANHARTRCHDGLLRPRCYVAGAVGKDRLPPRTSVPDGALAWATIEPRSFDGLGKLGVLVVADAFSPAGRAVPSGRFFRLVDTGIRCIRAPCFSIRASQLNRLARTTVSDVDARAPQATPGETARAEAALGSTTGLFAQGRIVPGLEGGRLFRPTRFFLRSES
jgi:hypothetical protein